MSADFYLKKLEPLVGGTITGLVRHSHIQTIPIILKSRLVLNSLGV